MDAAAMPPAPGAMSHGRAAALMVVATLLWSTAGVVSRHLEAAASFEVTFWRSLFNFLSLALLLSVLRGPGLWRSIWRAPRGLWASGICWSVMFTAFMVAITLTRVANVLITMSIGPLLTAVFARVFLGARQPARTWAAIGAAGVGMAWMFAQGLADGASADGGLDAHAALGMAIALAVPLAAAANWTLLHHHGRAAPADAGPLGGAEDPPVDMLPAVMIGAALSALSVLAPAWPLRATPHDVALLAGLGAFQLAVPCLMVVRLARELPAPEMSLLSLLEVVFGVLWTWLGASEAPTPGALAGGALVIGALVVNECWALRSRRRDAMKGMALR